MSHRQTQTEFAMNARKTNTKSSATLAKRKSIVACILILEMFISADHNRISVRAGLLDVVITFNSITLLAENCKHPPKGPPNPNLNKARF